MNIEVDVRRSASAQSATGAIAQDWQSRCMKKCRRRRLSQRELKQLGRETDQDSWRFMFQPDADITSADQLWLQTGVDAEGVAVYAKHRVNVVYPAVGANKRHHFEVDCTVVT